MTTWQPIGRGDAAGLLFAAVGAAVASVVSEVRRPEEPRPNGYDVRR
jgi:hypothetical protein